MMTQTIGDNNIHTGSWSGTRKPDPFNYGLGAFQANDVDQKEVQRRRDKGRRKVTTNKVNPNIDKAYRVAEYIFRNGEFSMTRAIPDFGIASNALKLILSSETYLFGGKRWVVYQEDNSRIIGLVNKDGETAKDLRRLE